MCILEIELSVGCAGAFCFFMLFVGKKPADFCDFLYAANFNGIFLLKSSVYLCLLLYFLVFVFVCVFSYNGSKQREQ